MSTGDAHTDAIAERCVAESKKDTGGPAFARPYSGTINYAQDGMSLRDYFAAKAMQGMFANPDDGHDMYEMSYADYVKEIARCAYLMADAMLKARKL